MGILLSQAKYLIKNCIEHDIKDSIITLGRLDFFLTLTQFNLLMQEFNLSDGVSFYNKDIDNKVNALIKEERHTNRFFKNKKVMSELPISDILFYTALGFNKIDCIDVENTRGEPSIIFDLNNSNLKESIADKYNLVLDAGVMEHVFDIRSLMLNITDITEVDGFLIHILPSNNTLDHGFYQFSPTLFKDYYEAQKYDIKNISLLEIQEDNYCQLNTSFVDKWYNYRIWDYDNYLMSKNSFGQLSNNIYYTLSCVQKKKNSLRDIAPIQYLYQKNSKLLSPWS